MKLRMGGKQSLFRKGSLNALIFERLQRGMGEDDIVREIIEKCGKTEQEADQEIRIVKTAKIRRERVQRFEKPPGVRRITREKDISGGVGILDRATVVDLGALCAAVFFLRAIV